MVGTDAKTYSGVRFIEFSDKLSSYSVCLHYILLFTEEISNLVGSDGECLVEYC